MIFSGWLCSFLGVDENQPNNPANDLGFTQVTIAALEGHAKGPVKYIHTLDGAIIIAADTIAGDIQGLLDGIEFEQASYALDSDSRKAALARFLKKASGGDLEAIGEELRLAHTCRVAPDI